MLRSNHSSGQSLIWLVCIASLLALGACGDHAGGGEEQPEDEFRAALVSEADVKLNYDAGETRSNGLNDEFSGVALLTADTVTSTNHLLAGHLILMRVIVSLPPTIAEEDRRVWEGANDGVFARVEVERSQHADGTRFDYSMTARHEADADDQMLPIFDGHVVRIEPSSDHRDGWGVVRYRFDNINALDPSEQVGGEGRVTFRRVADVHQVRVHLIDVQTPDHPNFPDAVAYDYEMLPDRSGQMKWHTRADFNQDGQQPLEDLAAHATWTEDLSGAGVIRATDGTLGVDYIRSAQCWNQRLRMTYEHASWPQGHSEDGQRADCVGDTDQLEPPAALQQLSGDPDIPQQHPAEQ